MRSTIRRPDDSAPPLVQRLVTTSVGRLALALLVVELLAGMQTYLNQTILPLLATDLRARNHYGLVTAAGTVPTFLTMPLGGAMLSRWRAGPLMTSLTALLVAGAVLGAAAPDISVYAAGEVLRGLAAGALSTITMGVMVAGLPEAWRRLCLAAGSAMWVLSSLVGPVYAAGISATWGWRWALVAYTPVLVMARLVMARQMGGLRMSEEEARPPVLPALALASGVAALGIAPTGTPWLAVAGAAGGSAVVWACGSVFPSGVMRLEPGRRSAIATLAWVCTTYFSLDLLISPSAHDVLDLGPGRAGLALTLAGVGWSAVAMWTGAHPARPRRAYLTRVGAGCLLFAVGGGLVAGALASRLPWWTLHLGWALCGLGMGLVHQDTMIRCVTAPTELGEADDGLSPARVATSVTVADSAGAAGLGTFVTAAVAPSEQGIRSIWSYRS